MNKSDRIKAIVHASWISIAGNAILAVLKIILGVFANSMAVLGDGIDSLSDVIGSIITLITARIMKRPPDIRFPYGYTKADTIATKALSFIILFAGAQLAISTIHTIVEGEKLDVLPSNLAIIVTIVSIIGKLLLSWHQSKEGKRVESKMLIANAINMKNDVIISATVLVSLIITKIFNLAIVDHVTAFIVSIWIIRSGYIIFMESNVELMDGNADPDLYKKIFEAVKSVKGASNPHRVRIRKTGYLYVIGIDIEVPGLMTVYRSHILAHEVEEKIRRCIKNVYDVVVHVEPTGDYNAQEKFGISEGDLEETE